ncbi:type I polyketide synthase [Streptomyces sp. NPDC050658]|uniref:type I polyketide synthase n=1 Tax=unclassified Streptomyces TaxID=2593676 RepID=UPI00342E6974
MNIDDVRDTDIAIIGMACRVPGATSADKFWQNLSEGEESTTFFTDEQLLAAGGDPADLDDPRYVRAAQILAGAEEFDADLFGLTADEAEIMDPQHRQFLECAVELLENAGYRPDGRHGLVGVFAGAGLNTYLLNNLRDRYETGTPLDRWRLMIASDKDFLASRVAYALNLQGPGIVLNTACSTSLVAVHTACLSLLSGECEMAIAGASRLAVPQTAGYLYQEGMIASPDGSCRAFDARAEGTVFGNGVGAVLLKPLRAALTDADFVHAVIRGSAVNNDGATKAGYTAPSVQGQTSVVLAALAAADVDPATVSYVEAHGTATLMGDPIEVAALTHAYRQFTDLAGFCALGSVKTNIGHLDTAAGMAGLIKTAMMLRYRTLVPSLNYTDPNPGIDFTHSPFFVNTELGDWPRGTTPRRAGVSAFGIGGTNAHLILEEAPHTPARPMGSGPELIILSARSAAALESAAAALGRHLKRHQELRLDDVAMTLATGRRQDPHRLALVAVSSRDAAFTLAVADEDRLTTGRAPDHTPTLAFTTPGIGCGPTVLKVSQTLPGLGPILAECTDDYQAVLTAGGESAELLAHYALARLWQSWGVHPSAVAGTAPAMQLAACLSGDMPLADALAQAHDSSSQSADDTQWFAVDGSGGDGPRMELGLCLPQEPDTALVHLLERAAELWVAGIDLDWASLYADRGCRRVPLPSTPFEHRRHWVDPAAATRRHDSEGLAAKLAVAAPTEREDLVIRFLQDHVARILAMPAGQLPNAEHNLFDLGLDSLILIDVVARLSAELRQPLRSTAFAANPTLRGFVRSHTDVLGLPA